MPENEIATETDLTSPEELQRIERFIAAYNTIDDWIQRQLNTEQSFRSAVDLFAKRHPYWHDAETLRVFAALRNFLIHEKVRPFDYPAVPGEGAVREIEAIRSRLIAPKLLGDEFAREVLTLAPNDALRDALNAMVKRGFRRFPIYQNQQCTGLLTERGIARYLAELTTNGRNFDANVPVKNVLERETKRKNYRFAAPNLPVAQVGFWFHEDTFLETVLISNGGNDRGELIGIVTRGDVAGWSE